MKEIKRKKDKHDILVLKAQQGSKEALSELYEIFHNEILYFLYSRIDSLQDAKDLTADVFLSAIEGIDKFKFRSSFKNYLYGIAKVKLINYIKSKYKENSFVLESNMSEYAFDSIPGEEHDDKAMELKHRNKIRNLFEIIKSRLSPRHAKVLDLRFMKSNSVSEAADILGITSNNLKVLQHRAIKAAQKEWNLLKSSTSGNYVKSNEAKKVSK